MTVVIKAANLGKVYAINHEASASRSLGATLEGGLRKIVSLGRASLGRAHAPAELAPRRRSVEQFRALDDVSFDVRQGDRVGVLGKNGAGKSTLLKIISRVVEPTSGSLTLRGRIASLLEVGTGFHPELTGRENVFLNGAILGMSRTEIARKFDEVVDFAEIERFIDTPVKFYSSGMYVRLAFAVSAHLDPDILILDEVLAVGDMRFQRKCIDKMQLAGREGRTLLFVSHSTQAIIQTCKTALYLKDGQLRSQGPVESVISDYTMDNVVAAPAATSGSVPDPLQLDASSDGWLQGEYTGMQGEFPLYREAGDFADCIEARLLNASGKVSARLPIHESFRCTLRYRLNRDVPFRMVPNFHFYQEDGQRFFIAFPEQAAPSTAGEYEATCIVPAFLVNTGRYTITLALSSYELPNPVHFSAERALRFEIVEPQGSDPRRHGWTGALPGVSRVHLAWEISGK